MTTRNLKGTWSQAIWSLLWPLFIVLAARWALLEPYVIPSGSMIPNLLIYDHILVNKFSYGIRLPFSERWLARWSQPLRGDVIVFRYPETPSVFYVKRLIGIPGDRIRVREGRLFINDQSVPLQERQAPIDLSPEDAEGFDYFTEDLGPSHVIRFHRGHAISGGYEQEWVVPTGSYFFMGDNRDQSHDSRAWGFVPESHLIGKAWVIWLSCDRMLESARFLCDPSSMRWQRLLTRGGL